MNILKSRKKINLKIIVVAFMLLFVSLSTNTFASTNEETKTIFDFESTNGVYKFSENNDIYLPFIRYATDRIVVDKPISKLGGLFSSKSIEVNEKMNGLKLLFATDSVRVNSEMEYPIILSGGNVVIDSNISKSAIIIASDSITITDKANISDDIILMAKTIEIEGNVQGSVLGAADTINVKGNISNDLRVDATNVNISGDKNVLGNIYVRTTNTNLEGIKDTYKSATIEVYNNKAQTMFTAKMITKIITSCLLLSLVFILIEKLSKQKFSSAILKKTSERPLFVIISGTLFLVAMPIVLIALIVGCMFSLSAIAFPILVAYIAFAIIVFSLSTFIVGVYLYSYVKAKYMKNNNIWMDIVGTFTIFILLKVLASIELISAYVIISLLIFSVGISLSVLFKKQKN